MSVNGDGAIFAKCINHQMVRIVPTAMYAWLGTIIIVYGWEHALGNEIIDSLCCSMLFGCTIWDTPSSGLPRLGRW